MTIVMPKNAYAYGSTGIDISARMRLIMTKAMREVINPKMSVCFDTIGFL